MNLAPLVRIIIYLTFFIPLFFTYFISRRIEVRLRGRFSRFFWLSVIFIAGDFVLSVSESFLPPLAPAVDTVYTQAGMLCLLMGAFFMYLFLLKLREKMGGEDPYDRMTKFVAPMILPIVLAFCMFVPLTYLARLYAGESVAVSWYGFADEIVLYISDFLVFYLTFLSYLECKDLLRSLKVVHKPMIISALCLLFIPLLLYGNLFVSLCFGNTPLFDQVFPYGYTLNRGLDYSAILVGFTAGMANMVLFYLKTRKPVEIKKEQEGFYPFALFQFVTKISEVIGSSSLTIFRSAVEGYNQRFGRDIRINDTISLSDVRDYEWQDLLAFILDVYYQCTGPVTWEVAKEVEGLKEIKRQSHSIG